jgi:hypothetical protein
MKTMSRSRYHALSWSFTRMRGQLRISGVKRTRRTGHAVAASVISGTLADRAGSGGSQRDKGFQGGFPVRAFRSLITFFRTGVLPGDTDI